MDTVVASHTTALRAIRCARRRSYLLPWDGVDECEQRRALSTCSPAARALDWDLLACSGMVDADNPMAHILVANPNERRKSAQVSCHVAAATLPPCSLLRVRSGLYVASPALCCLQYAETHSLIQTLYTTQAAELRTMGAMGYDATTAGNHEFDHEGGGFAQMLQAAVRSGDDLPALLMANYAPAPDNPEALEIRRAMAPVRTMLLRFTPASALTTSASSWGEVVVFAVAARVIALVDRDSSLMGVAYHFLGASFSLGLVFLISLYLYISASFAFRLIIAL